MTIGCRTVGKDVWRSRQHKESSATTVFLCASLCKAGAAQRIVTLLSLLRSRTQGHQGRTRCNRRVLRRNICPLLTASASEAGWLRPPPACKRWWQSSSVRTARW